MRSTGESSGGTLAPERPADSRESPTGPGQAPDSRLGVGEIAAVVTARGPESIIAAESLLVGYAGPARERWSEGKVSFACAGGAEISVFDDLVVMVDARLDNRRELARIAGLDPTASAAELLAGAWRRLGADSLDLTVGELAAVIVERAAGRVYALRDLCAGRPLHVTHTDSGWALASESATRRRGEPPPRAESGMVRGRIRRLRDDAKATPYAGIEVVLPGHVATPAISSWRQMRAARWHVPQLTDESPGAYASSFVRSSTRPSGAASRAAAGSAYRFPEASTRRA